MSRIAVLLPRDAMIEAAVRGIIKNKTDAALITNDRYEAIGVVSTTDLMYAYYAGVPIGTHIEAIMRSPPLCCLPDDSLDSALDAMRNHKVSRLYVLGDIPDHAIGVLSYPDIVGLLYRYCHQCEFSTIRHKNQGQALPAQDLLSVCEVMEPGILSFRETDSLLAIMEGLSVRGGTALIMDAGNRPAGVVSKTDLILAYRHGIPSSSEASTVMSAPVRACDKEEPLAAAIQKMIFSDLNLFFVYKGNPDNIIGVLSLADAARVRSGSCRACISSRIEIDDS